MFLRTLLTALALLAASHLPVAAADDPQAALRARLARLEALRAERPGDGLLVYYQAMAYAELGERDKALAALGSLQGRQLGLLPAPGLGFDALWDDPAFQVLRFKLEDEEPKTPEAPIGFRLRDARLIPEGIAYDPAGRRFFVGSIAQRKILAVDRNGRARDFSQPGDGLDAVLGLAVDAPRKVLYAVSSNALLAGATPRRNAVLRYDLVRGKRAARHEAPEATQLNDVAVAADGTLYATDSASGTLFRMRPGQVSLHRLGEAGALRGANGVAVAPDGTVYVTLSTGIARVDPASAAMQRLPQPDTVVTGGIDGLYWHEGELLGIQNSTNPGRVVRIALADGGTRIAGLTVLQSHLHPDFAEPTTGAIAGSALYVIANSFVGHYQPDGGLRDPAALRRTVVVAVPLRR